MRDRAALFLDLSAWLTGWSPFVLSGTGLVETYLAALDARLPPGLLDGLLAREAEDAVMDDARLGPVARTIILLWYTGTWQPLPDSPPDPDRPRVISAEAYAGGLMWRAAGAHPAGAQQQGFGAWALPPEASP